MGVAPVNRILLDVAQAVMHPAHVPFDVEAQPPCSGGFVTPGQAVDSSAIVIACGQRS